MSKTNDERIVTFDYDELATFSDDVCELVPLSQKDVSILVSCLRFAHWAARWFAGDDRLRELGRLADLEEALTYVELLEAKLLMSGCLEGLISVMGEIRDALKAQAICCQTSANGVRMVDLGEGDLVYGTQQPLTPPTEFGGEGQFENEEAYNTHRCAAANNIVAGLILSLNSWSTLSLASLLVGSIVVAFFVANPPLGVVLALAMVGMAFGVLLTMSNYIADNREAWVCTIYNAEDYADFLARVDDKVSDMVIELDIAGFEVQITELIHSVLDTDTFNKMFTVIGLPEVQNPVDCSLCAPAIPELTLAEYWGEYWGVVDSGDLINGVVQITSNQVNWGGFPPDNVPVWGINASAEARLVSVTIVSGEANIDRTSMYNGTETIFEDTPYTSGMFDDKSFTAWSIVGDAGTNFTIAIEWEGVE